MNKDIVIVTGVSGQMGSFFAEFLLKKGFHVIGTVRRISVKNYENIKCIDNPDFTLAPMDLGDTHSVNHLIEKYRPKFFVNCAANSFVGSSWEFPEQHMDFNCLGVLRQLEAIKRFSPSTRYVNFGSSEEMGDVLNSPQNEDHPARARSPYAVSKIAARQMIKVYRDSFGLFALQCWCFNYESERRGLEFVTRKITSSVAAIKTQIDGGQTPIPLKLGNVDSYRDWSHAQDFIRGVWMMLNQETPKEYVLSSGETHSVREFVEKAFARAGIWGKWRGDGMNAEFTNLRGDIVYVKVDPEFFRPADVTLLHGDSSRARKELGWKPEISFDELVNRMVDNDIENS